ncbi:ABC transporter ATP-binding protein [Nakamurella flavida]|uniref:ABC transporter ATP-binding protein n=1 Tax=Nakamurella flavida TaxID=363630 RepID=A0A938YFK8_9ACTN|nr:ABC transporter ATP-binding protein [Nakamurella flavida]MBM9476766.1 ABC transporter ATP-binding protein [Nakamurella flavida]MDP9778796.1 multiple sugar transport system ATP-binding protein [Nakamurella flavida]
MATLTVSGLNKTYGKKQALHDVDLDIADGEFFVMLGPSGAGKTTTLKSIAGLQEIDSGTVTIAGRDMTGVEPYRRNVGMAFESYALYPQRTVSENLASPLKSKRLGTFSAQDQKDRIDAVTTTLGINHLLSRLPRELSNGQRQRVALGRVLVRPADVYLLDEPLSHLDAKLRAAMRAELKRLGQMSNTTTVYVTHDYQEALSLGDRIGVLKEGRLVQVGTPADVWLRPVDSFVARALGQPEMNLLPARVDGGALVAGDGAVRIPLTGGDLAVRPGDDVRLGIRPGDVRATVDEEPADGRVTMAGRVELAERLGRQIELSVRVGDANLIVLSDGAHPFAEGDRVALSVATAKVHVFAGSAGNTAEAITDDTARLGAADGTAHRGPAHAPPAGRAASTTAPSTVPGVSNGR